MEHPQYGLGKIHNDYGQGSLDPYKAQAESIYVLSKALGCSVEELLRG